jgi:hypothetical protein
MTSSPFSMETFTCFPPSQGFSFAGAN